MLPITDCYTKAESLSTAITSSMGLTNTSTPVDVLQEVINYGLVATQGKYVSNFNDLTRGGLYYWDENSANSPISGSGAAMVIPNSNGRYVFVSDISQRKYERYYVNSQWTNWIYINPPFVAGQEYLTSEFRNGVSVVKKLDTDGIMKWRLSTESTWHVEGGVDNNDLVQQGYIKIGTLTEDSDSFPFATTALTLPSEIVFQMQNVYGSRVGNYNAYSSVDITITNRDIRKDDGDVIALIHGGTTIRDVNRIIKYQLSSIYSDNNSNYAGVYANSNQFYSSTTDNYKNSNFYLYNNALIEVTSWNGGVITVWKK